MEFYDFVQTELDDTSGIITRLPREVALFTNRRSTPPRHAAGDAEHYSADGVSAIIARARDMNFH